MALKCDICLKTVPRGKGYALTTSQVVYNRTYWEYAFYSPVGIYDEAREDAWRDYKTK